MSIGRFNAGIAALIWSPETQQYLLLRRSAHKDYAPRVWECVTGRVDQGEGFEDALRREVYEELGLEVQIEAILGTTHFYRGEPEPENELLGVVYFCSLSNPAAVHISQEHSDFRWLSAQAALELLTATDPSTRWIRRVIERAEMLRAYFPLGLTNYAHHSGFELG